MKLYPSVQDRLNNQHEAIREIISDIPEKRIHAAIIQDKWSMHDHIAHLARYQPIFIDRIHSILLYEEPGFESYVGENDAEFPAWRTMEINTLLEHFDKDRKAIFRLISTMPENKLARTGIHKKFGRLNIVQWTEFFLLHEAHHIYTIFQLGNGGSNPY